MTMARRWTIAGAVPVAMAAVMAGSAVAFIGRVPDPVATHFSPVRADGATGVWPFTWGVAVVVLAACAAVAYGALSARITSHTRRVVVASRV